MSQEGAARELIAIYTLIHSAHHPSRSHCTRTPSHKYLSNRKRKKNIQQRDNDERHEDPRDADDDDDDGGISSDELNRVDIIIVKRCGDLSRSRSW